METVTQQTESRCPCARLVGDESDAGPIEGVTGEDERIRFGQPGEVQDRRCSHAVAALTRVLGGSEHENRSARRDRVDRDTEIPVVTGVAGEVGPVRREQVTSIGERAYDVTPGGTGGRRAQAALDAVGREGDRCERLNDAGQVERRDVRDVVVRGEAGVFSSAQVDGRRVRRRRVDRHRECIGWSPRHARCVKNPRRDEVNAVRQRRAGHDQCGAEGVGNRLAEDCAALEQLDRQQWRSGHHKRRLCGVRDVVRVGDAGVVGGKQVRRGNDRTTRDWARDDPEQQVVGSPTLDAGRRGPPDARRGTAVGRCDRVVDEAREARRVRRGERAREDRGREPGAVEALEPDGDQAVGAPTRSGEQPSRPLVEVDREDRGRRLRRQNMDGRLIRIVYGQHSVRFARSVPPVAVVASADEPVGCADECRMERERRVTGSVGHCRPTRTDDTVQFVRECQVDDLTLERRAARVAQRHGVGDETAGARARRQRESAGGHLPRPFDRDRRGVPVRFVGRDDVSTGVADVRHRRARVAVAVDVEPVRVAAVGVRVR